MRVHFVSSVALAVVAFAPAVQGQTRGPYKVQVTVGAATSTGGDYEERDETNVELFAAYRWDAGGKLLLTGVSVGKNFVTNDELTCRVATGGGCVPYIPRFRYASLQFGGEMLKEHLGVTAGPALVWGDGQNRFGAQVRADFILPIRAPIVFVVSPRLVLVPNFYSETLILRSVSMGLRFH